MGVIYKITNPKGKIYIGQTYNYKQRISDYKCLRYRSKRSMIIWSVKKYGWDLHKMEIIEEVDDCLLDEREIFWIKEFNTYAYENSFGMNLTRGGLGQRHSWKNDLERVAKAKLRCGIKSPGFGKKPTQETRKKISEGVKRSHLLTGRKFTKEAIEKGRQAHMKPIVSYDLNGIFLAEYPSIKIAADKLKIDRKSINDAVNGIQQHSGKIIFRPKTEDYPLKIDVSGINILIQKRPVLCFINSHVIEYKNAAVASTDLKLDLSTIRTKLSKADIKPNRKGYVFIYKDLWERRQQTA